ncbi:MAG: hypothetical protein JSV88_22105 [Candidatus Aminicenantes bacterium]|nr:MAG: hypothetical protein JSV88_22105 [Candidatus Aminicenantes bacterium]
MLIYKKHKSLIIIFTVLALPFLLLSQNSPSFFPDNHRDLKQPINYSTMADFLDSVKDRSFIEVTVEGQSIQNRSLYLVHLNRKKGKKNQWRVFFFAQQHGNETSGKDALLYLLRYISEKPKLLPPDVDLWIMPMVNPDGAEANQRRNANEADLNRDHVVLAQPETQTLHHVCRRIMPHVSVDCHEFTRDSRGYTEKGWLEWPIIMMDCSNNPLFYPQLYKAGLRWCEKVKSLMKRKGHDYCRYFVGNVPPEGELRHSTPEVDDARNGLGAYQGLSFIIEAGVLRRVPNPNADLAKRVDAYLILLNRFLKKDKFRKQDMTTIQLARKAKIPGFIPTNYFWANQGQKIISVKVIDKTSGETIEIPTANFMKDLVVKRSVPTPGAYIIHANDSSGFISLLDRHAIPYSILREPGTFMAESCQLIRIEEPFDEVYFRYEGRQIVKQNKAEKKEFPAGSVLVPIRPLHGIRAILILEPMKLYGLFKYPEFQKMVKENKILPVWRVIQ